jgi:Uma2 family endonuclease
MTADLKLMTADELIRLPRGRERHELVRGLLRTMPLATWPEAIPANNSIDSLRPYESDRRPHAVMTGVGFQLSWDPDTVRAPDVAFLSPRRLREVEGVTGYVPGAPDLAVEVISPTDLYLDVEDTIAEWLEHGTQVVFVVNPWRKVVAVHRPGQPVVILGIEDTLSAEDVVPGWSLAVRDLFDESY